MRLLVADSAAAGVSVWPVLLMRSQTAMDKHRFLLEHMHPTTWLYSNAERIIIIHTYITQPRTHTHTMACCVRSQTFELVYIRIWTCYYFFLLHLLRASSLCWTGFALVQNLIVYNVHIAVSNDVSLFIYSFSLSLSHSLFACEAERKMILNSNIKAIYSRRRRDTQLNEHKSHAHSQTACFQLK